jgi:hypothetical protein
MARNGAGVFAVINPILIGALRSSSAVNADFTDMGTAITDTIALNGEQTMSGQFRAWDGTRAQPGMSFHADTNTGFRRATIDEMRWVGGGTDRFYIDEDGNAWQLAAQDIAGATSITGGMTGTASDPIVISELDTVGAAKRTGTNTWAIETFPLALQLAVGGSGATIQTGICGDLQCPVAGTITSVALQADQSGSVAVSVWKDTYANYPPTILDVISNGYSITDGTALLDSTLSGWTTSVAAGDCFRFNIDSCTSITRLMITLQISRFTGTA